MVSNIMAIRNYSMTGKGKLKYKIKWKEFTKNYGFLSLIMNKINIIVQHTLN